ncbi:MAG TPA: copper homeostasis protein CutC [Gemmata sp.]|nr:copper homeostasis protein CutC [Gemmata sp.]
MTPRIALEIAVSTPDEAILAEANGADRLELSSGLEVGGLTPSLGLFRAVKRSVKLPVYVLIRPRPAGFCYSPREFEVMLDDAREFMAAGAAGLVFGVLTDEGTIDRERCAELARVAGKGAVFHRAFDLLTDQFRAMDELVEIGFHRVLTSGGEASAQAGAARLASLIRHAGGRIEVLPGGGIRAENIAELVRQTRCEQVHSSARSASTIDPTLARNTGLAAAFGGDAKGSGLAVSAALVAGLRRELDRLAISLSSPV